MKRNRKKKGIKRRKKKKIKKTKCRRALHAFCSRFRFMLYVSLCPLHLPTQLYKHTPTCTIFFLFSQHFRSSSGITRRVVFSSLLLLSFFVIFFSGDDYENTGIISVKSLSRVVITQIFYLLSIMLRLFNNDNNNCAYVVVV